VLFLSIYGASISLNNFLASLPVIVGVASIGLAISTFCAFSNNPRLFWLGGADLMLT